MFGFQNLCMLGLKFIYHLMQLIGHCVISIVHCGADKLFMLTRDDFGLDGGFDKLSSFEWVCPM